MKIVFMGTAAFAVPSLQALKAAGHEISLVVCQPDRPKGRGQQLQAPPLKAAALDLGMEVFQPLKVKEAAALERLQSLKMDLLCVVAYGQILPKVLLDAPKLMALNLHASLLPKYRGAAPIEWAVASGETETGICVQRMAERLDAGDVIARSKLGIGPQDDAENLTPRLAEIGAVLLRETVESLAQGKAHFEIQDEALATYAPLLKKEHGAADFSRPAAEIHDHFRAFKARPGFYAGLEKQTLKVHGLSLGEACQGEPGSLLQIKQRGFEAACGDRKSVWIESVQAQAGKPMPAADYARGHGLKAGMKFERLRA